MSTRGKPKPLMHRFVIVLVALASAVAWYNWLLVIPIGKALVTTGVSLAEFLEWETGEFSGAFLETLFEVLNPLRAWRVAGPLRWVMLLATAFSIWACSRAARGAPARIAANLGPLALLIPFYVGLLLLPIEIKKVFRVLARVS